MKDNPTVSRSPQSIRQYMIIILTVFFTILFFSLSVPANAETIDDLPINTFIFGGDVYTIDSPAFTKANVMRSYSQGGVYCYFRSPFAPNNWYTLVGGSNDATTKDDISGVNANVKALTPQQVADIPIRFCYDENSNPNGQPTSRSPLRLDTITIVNNAGAADTIDINQLFANDVIKVYDAAAGGNVIAEGTVASDGNSIQLTVAQLGTAAGHVYITATSVINSVSHESTRVEVDFAAEGGGDVASQLAARMEAVYLFFEQADKDNINAARTALAGLSDAELNTVIDPLINATVNGKLGGEANARTQLRAFIRDFGQIYYSSNQGILADELRTFKSNYAALFTNLFGSGITAENIYDLLVATQEEIPNVVNNSAEPDTFFTKTDEELKGMWPQIGKTAMENVMATPTFSAFNSKLGDIGWSSAIFIERQQALAAKIDINNACELSFGKAFIRSQTKLVSGDTTIDKSVKDNTTFLITIMGLGQNTAAGKVLWKCQETSIADFATGIYKNKLKATAGGGTGTVHITVYRDVAGATPENDWILKFTVNVID